MGFRRSLAIAGVHSGFRIAGRKARMETDETFETFFSRSADRRVCGPRLFVWGWGKAADRNDGGLRHGFAMCRCQLEEIRWVETCVSGRSSSEARNATSSPGRRSPKTSTRFPELAPVLTFTHSVLPPRMRIAKLLSMVRATAVCGTKREGLGRRTGHETCGNIPE